MTTSHENTDLRDTCPAKDLTATAGPSPENGHESVNAGSLPQTGRLSEITTDDARDSIDDLNDAIDRVREALNERGASKWLIDTMDEHFARLRSPFRISATTGVPRQRAISLAVHSLERLVTSAIGGSGVLVADLQEALALFGDRNARIACRLIGIGCERPLTLEEVGLREGVTRERIRQIRNRFLPRLASWRPPLVSLALLQSALDGAGPVITEAELTAKLPRGVLSGIDDLQTIPGLLSLGWLSGIMPTRFDGAWVHDPTTVPALDECVRHIRKNARQPLRRWGAFDLSQAGTWSPDFDPHVTAQLAIQKRAFDVIDGWAVLRDARATVVRDRVLRIAEVTQVVSQRALRRALKKSIRGLPPDSVLTRVLQRDVPSMRLLGDEQLDLGVRSNGRLSRSEFVAQRLLREQGGATTLRTLQRKFVREGLSSSSATVAFGRSPILERLAYGVIGLIGSTVAADTISELRKQVRREAARAFIGYRMISDDIELSYRLDPTLLSSTAFLIPRNVVSPGRWTLIDRAGDVVVKKTYVTGLHRVARGLVESGARGVTVVFKRTSRTVEVRPR